VGNNSTIGADKGQPRSTVVAATHRFKTPDPAKRRPSIVGRQREVASAAVHAPPSAGDANVLTIDASEESSLPVEEPTESPKRQMVAVPSKALTARPHWPVFLERCQRSAYFDSISVRNVAR
jgi:hypothetical protein